MGSWIGIGISFKIASIIAIIFGRTLSNYYESEQYKKDLEDGLYDEDSLD